MGAVLPIELRPKRLSELVGQKVIVEAVAAQAKAGRLPRSWMIYGPSGCGKTTIARILALSYQASAPEDGEFGEPSDALWARYEEFGIQEINASQVNGVEALGKIADESQYLPCPPAKCRVYILDEAQRISDAAQNLLLKYLEDTPKTTAWIICTTAPQKILPTVRRRCYTMRVQPLTEDGLARLLKRALKRLKCARPVAPLVEALGKAGVNAPAMALMAAEKYAAGVAHDAAVFSSEGGVDSLAVCRSLLRGEWPNVRRHLKDISADDARMLRLAILGYLKSVLLGEQGALSVKAAKAIQQLAALPPIEDPAFIAWLAALLRLECSRFAEAPPR
jgi:hypothetical protein